MAKGAERIGIFPRQVDNNFQGYKIAAIVFFMITIFTFVRSCIHIFAPDGGASSIAGVNTSVEGGSDIISMFAFWGLSQFLMGIVYLVVFLRYKSLIPFMYLLILVEYSGRVLIGLAKPLIVSHTPPGAIGNYVLIPLAALMLILSLKKHRKRSPASDRSIDRGDSNRYIVRTIYLEEEMHFDQSSGHKW